MDFKKGLSHAIKSHFLPNVTSELDAYELTIQGVCREEHDILSLNIVDTVTGEEADFEMYAVELAHLVTENVSDWKWLSKGWDTNTELSIRTTMGKVLLEKGIDIREKLPEATITYLGNNLNDYPVVRVMFKSGSLYQREFILHIPVAMEKRPVQQLMAVDYSPFKSIKIGRVE